MFPMILTFRTHSTSWVNRSANIGLYDCGEGRRHYRYKAADEYLRTFNVDGDRNWRDYDVLWGLAVVDWVLVRAFVCKGKRGGGGRG